MSIKYMDIPLQHQQYHCETSDSNSEQQKPLVSKAIALFHATIENFHPPKKHF